MSIPSDVRKRVRVVAPLHFHVLRAIACLAMAAVVASTVPGCAADFPPGQVSISEHGFTVTLDGATASAETAVATLGSRVTMSADDHEFPEEFAQDFIGLSAPVKLVIGDGEQPTAPITLSFAVDPADFVGEDPPAGKVFAFLAQSEGEGAPTLVPATFDPVSNLMTAQIDHLSWFQPVQFDLGKLLNEFRAFVMQALSIEFPDPDCTRTVTHESIKYSVITQWGAWPCLSIERGKLVVDLHSNSPIPFELISVPTVPGRPLPGLTLSALAATVSYHAINMFNPVGRALLTSGGVVRYEFSPNGKPVVIKFAQYPAAMLVSILAATLETILPKWADKIEGLKHLGKLPCIADILGAAASKATVELLSGVAKAFFSCVSPLLENALGARIIMAIISAAPAFFAASFIGVINEITGRGRFDVTVDVINPPKATPIAPRPVTPPPSATPSLEATAQGWVIDGGGIGPFRHGARLADLRARFPGISTTARSNGDCSCVFDLKLSPYVALSMISTSGIIRATAVHSVAGSTSMRGSPRTASGIHIGMSMSRAVAAMPANKVNAVARDGGDWGNWNWWQYKDSAGRLIDVSGSASVSEIMVGAGDPGFWAW